MVSHRCSQKEKTEFEWKSDSAQVCEKKGFTQMFTEGITKMNGYPILCRSVRNNSFTQMFTEGDLN